MLLTFKQERPSIVTLCGLALDQTEANFAGQALNPADANILALEIAVRPSLKRLLIGNNGIGDKGCTAVALAMQQTKSCKIKELNLAENKIGAQEAILLAAMMAVRGSLTQINLSGNFIRGYYDVQQAKFISTPEGPKAIADAIRIRGSLTVADLRFNQLDTESATMLATVAKEKKIFLCGITPEQTEANLQ
eukprot:5094972-Prymnesium_polylepis.1